MTARPRPSQRFELVGRCWRLRTVAGGQEVVCGIFQTDAGLEVRAVFQSALLLSERAVSLVEAGAVAAEFRRTLMQELGGVEEMPLR